MPVIHLRPNIQLPPWLGVARVIRFDDVADGTVIDTHYAGVSLASITTNPPNQWNAFARATNGFTPVAESLPNVVSVKDPSLGYPSFDAADGGIQATFNVPQLYVSIDVCPVVVAEIPMLEVNKPFMQTFDAQGNVLHTVEYGPNFDDAAYGTWQPLAALSTSANIAKIVFSSERHSGTHVYGLFDRLVFASKVSIIPLGP